MTLYSPAQSLDQPRTGDSQRRFDIVTIGLHWATVTLIAGLFGSAWLLLASDREHAAMLLTIHRSLGVLTWAVAIVRLGWRFSYAYLPPFAQNMPKVQQRLAKTSEYGLYALLMFQPLTGLAQSLARGRHFMLFAWQVPKVMAGDKPLTMLFHQIHTVSACISWRHCFTVWFLGMKCSSRCWRGGPHPRRGPRQNPFRTHEAATP
jgi:cytochrome b561